MLHGVCLVFSAALLITPGFFTDGVGFLLLLPPVRALVIRLVLSRIRVFSGPGHAETVDKTVIDGDFRDVTDNEPTPHKTPSLPR